MRVLVLEDLASRVEWLTKRFPLWSVTWVVHPADATVALKDVVWDLVILDYDLDIPHVGYTGGVATGAWATQAVPCGTAVLVWSSNPYGVEQITSLLEDRKVDVHACPFDDVEAVLAHFDRTRTWPMPTATE